MHDLQKRGERLFLHHAALFDHKMQGNPNHANTVRTRI
jgi:hypothetical protein